MSDQAASMSIDTTPAASAAEDAGGAEETGDSAEGGASKKAIKKAAKDAEKAAQKAAKAAEVAEREQAQQGGPDPLAHKYGNMPLIQSQERTGKVWTNVKHVDDNKVYQTVTLRGRVHNVRGKGKSAFLVLRQQTATIQVIFFVDEVNVSKGMVKFVSNLTKESVVDIQGVVKKPNEPIAGCTQQTVELEASSIFCISRSEPRLPFEIDDAARPDAAFDAEDSQYVRVGQDTRLNHRIIDLRTPANQAIFRVQSGVCQLFREALQAQDFVEIHTPKLIGGASEGGASVFKLDYMGQPACLAQSPQLYKQMAVESDFERVFEIGPVFRAENSNTHRHLCEFTGLDMEMAIKEHYFEVLDVLDTLFLHMFDGLTERFAHELSVVNQQHPFEPLKYLRPTLRLEFPEGIRMLQEAGVDVDPLGDLSTETERVLGGLVKDKYDTDFYILHKYPNAARPFYTMPCPNNPDYSNSFDIFIRGEEIISGAQRVHDVDLLTKRAAEHGIEVETIQAYIDAFKYGATPHGGCGVGMERVVMLFLNLGNIRKTSMFPRDPKRLQP
uniref:aspartate--tRNA ligase n=1 Tax=Mantoniella antarctica TaxID=81844 RepID=A0A7S0SN35_9CHLO|mmetsp:Transcript_28088/g.70562  ORF Transcript_28088/g.70562 Transcript_28088/m.70562 type:complete len:555 (+) Transcript_28088:81-1745(+)